MGSRAKTEEREEGGRVRPRATLLIDNLTAFAPDRPRVPSQKEKTEGDRGEREQNKDRWIEEKE